jgi:hypothetical protein
MLELGYALSSEEFGPTDLIANARIAETLGFQFALRSVTSCRPPRSRTWNLRSKPPGLGERSPRKMLHGIESNANHALPQERKRREENTDMRRRFKRRSQVDHRPASGKMCPAELPHGNQFRRASVLLPRR